MHFQSYNKSGHYLILSFILFSITLIAQQTDPQLEPIKKKIVAEKFEEAKSKSSSLKDIVYLDGVLAVLDTIKNETFKSE